MDGISEKGCFGRTGMAFVLSLLGLRMMGSGDVGDEVSLRPIGAQGWPPLGTTKQLQVHDDWRSRHKTIVLRPITPLG